MARILITGFTPFDGREHNASWIAAKVLAEKHGTAHELRAQLIPVLWGAPFKVLDQLIREWRPHCVIGLGEGEPGVFRVETVAHNARKERADNDGVFPSGALIATAGPDDVQSSSDCAKLVTALTELDVPARLSDDAGAYLCEELLYTLETLKPEHSFLKQVLFVHLPPWQTALVYQQQNRRCDEALLFEFCELLLQSFFYDH